MLQPGDVIENPVLGLRAIITETDVETAGVGYTVENIFQPHCGRDPDHVHLQWDETFAVITGTARYVLDGVPGVMQAGDQLFIPAGKGHINPWNDSETVLHIRQIIRFPDADPARIQALLGSWATLHGLARDGKVNQQGMPNPLQFALSFRTLLLHGNYFTKIPIGVQQAIFAALAGMGRLAGYQPSYPRYTDPIRPSNP